MAFVSEFSKSVRLLQEADLPIAIDATVSKPWALLADAAEGALSRGETHYTDRPGILPLRQRVTDLLAARFRLVADPRSAAVITCGVIEARFVALQQVLSPGDALWTPDVLKARFHGAALLRRADLTKSAGEAKLICLTSSLGDVPVREALLQASADAVVLFEVDEEDSAFHPVQVEGFADRVLTVGQLGDPSWQMGYMVAPDKLAASLRDFKQALTICSTNLSQWAALAAMEVQ